MKKIGASLICVFLSVTLALSSASALSIQATDQVNLRSGPGLSYSILGSLSRGTIIQYLNESKIDDRGVAWYKVRFGDLDGWVSSRYSIIVDGSSSSPSGASAGSTVLTNGDVNIRSGPGLGYSVHASVTSGVTLSYLQDTQTDDRGVLWYKISFNGTTGWVSSKFASLKGVSSTIVYPTAAPSTGSSGKTNNSSSVSGGSSSSSSAGSVPVIKGGRGLD